MTTTVSVRPVTRADVGPLTEVLARAFCDDPPFVWMLPDDRTRLAGNRGIFRTAVKAEALRHGGVDAAWDTGSGQLVGGAIWYPPGAFPPSTLAKLRGLPGYARALGRRLGPASELVAAMQRAHPKTPAWYLYAIGVRPDHQGRGVGAALLRSRLEQVDRDGAAAYLESSKQRNVPLYERFGFTAAPPIPVPAGGPVLIPMTRGPRR